MRFACFPALQQDQWLVGSTGPDYAAAVHGNVVAKSSRVYSCHWFKSPAGPSAVCVLGSCQLPPRGEPGNTRDVAKADSCSHDLCGVVQNIRVVPRLDFASPGDIIAQGNVQ